MKIYFGADFADMKLQMLIISDEGKIISLDVIQINDRTPFPGYQLKPEDFLALKKWFDDV